MSGSSVILYGVTSAENMYIIAEQTHLWINIHHVDDIIILTTVKTAYNWSPVYRTLIYLSFRCAMALAIKQPKFCYL